MHDQIEAVLPRRQYAVQQICVKDIDIFEYNLTLRFLANGLDVRSQSPLFIVE